MKYVWERAWASLVLAQGFAKTSHKGKIILGLPALFSPTSPVLWHWVSLANGKGGKSPLWSTREHSASIIRSVTVVSIPGHLWEDQVPRTNQQLIQSWNSKTKRSQGSKKDCLLKGSDTGPGSHPIKFWYIYYGIISQWLLANLAYHSAKSPRQDAARDTKVLLGRWQDPGHRFRPWIQV